jgi:hypothetical protein
MKVWARADDAAGRIKTEHTKIKQKEKNNLFMAISCRVKSVGGFQNLNFVFRF